LKENSLQVCISKKNITHGMDIFMRNAPEVIGLMEKGGG
jgi:hypothetical protein